MMSRNRFQRSSLQLLCTVLLLMSIAALARAQTTTTFTYQGSLTGTVDAVYDLQFALYDTDLGGAPLAPAQTVAGVQITNGKFAVQLDFGAPPFVSGHARYLEIAVRNSGAAGAFIVLTPRQRITTAPYALRSQSAAGADSAARADTATNADDATKLGGIAAAQYVRTDDPRLTGVGLDYIQNTTQPQAANFNITGNGVVGGTLTAGVVSATTEFRIGANRVLSVNNQSTSLGIGAGGSGGRFNSVFGSSAGRLNQTGLDNSYFGDNAGHFNVSGSANSAFGSRAGWLNEEYENSFFGSEAGRNNQTGFNNSYFGSRTGLSNSSGTFNTYLGAAANSTNGLTNATAVGANALVTQSNSLVLGSILGTNGDGTDTNVGIGTTAPSDRLTVKTGTNTYGIVHTDGVITVGTFVGGAGQGGYLGTRSNHPFHLFANDGSASLTIDTSGRVRVVNLGAAGFTPLCRNAANQISMCSSSLRYKTNIAAFTAGLNLIRRLHPISFQWKEGGTRDLGLGAEDVASVEPRLVTYNEQGEVEGVKYDRVAVVLVNAVREQQAQLERQRAEINRLVDAVDKLRKLRRANRRGTK
jgi:hypothetical protein